MTAVTVKRDYTRGKVCEHYEKSLSMEICAGKFYHPEEMIMLCRECGNYGSLWSCPSFGPEERWWNGLSTLLLMADRFSLSEGEDQWESFLRIRRVLDNEILEREKSISAECSAKARALLPGSCILCGDYGGSGGESSGIGSGCTRKGGEPCRFPHLCRTSLEAEGFDVESMLKDTFGLSLSWSVNGKKSEYLTLVSAIIF